jgi:hypothetical protein
MFLKGNASPRAFLIPQPQPLPAAGFSGGETLDQFAVF